MNREIGRFLLETWQLFYWSLFCPSLLDDWWVEERNGSNFRFSYLIFNHLLVSLCQITTVLVFVCLLGKGESWVHWLLIVFPSILLINILKFYLNFFDGAYPICAMFFLSSLSLVPALITKHEFVFRILQAPTQQLLIIIGSLSVFSVILLHKLLDDYHRIINTFYWMAIVTVGLANALASIVASLMADVLSGFFTLCISSCFGLLSIYFPVMRIFDSGQDEPGVDSFIFSLVFSLIANVFAIIFSIHISLVASTSIALIYNLPLPLFLFAVALVAFNFTLFKDRWLVVLCSIIFITIGWRELSFNAIYAVPLSLIAYYRIFPDYLLSFSICLIFTQIQQKRFFFSPTSLLKILPPYTTEFLWLPIPNHAQILADTFNQDIAFGLATFKKMQSILLPGFQLTIQNALPTIVANRFAAVNSTFELIDSVRDSHERLGIYQRDSGVATIVLPVLIPSFYKFTFESSATPKSSNPEINLFFSFLQQTAEDTAITLQGGSSALRQRGLERLVDKLKMYVTQLPGMGLKTQAVKRWRPAIERWQHILELEIAEQQKTSQGELLNPFQFGNPLRPDRADIFKGRQDFADRLVRQILDRNRPTLVLHGPRRAGKTSFLLNLPRLLPSDLVPIYLDMQQGSMTASEGDFCYGLVRAIDRDTRSQGLQLPLIPSRQDFATQPYPTLEDWLDLALPKLGERRLLLNLDEFEKIGSAIKDGRISERLFDQLRSMIQHYDRLGFLFSGVQTLEELGPRWSNYFISVVPMEMHYLESHEAEDLLLDPDPEFTLRYDDGIVAEILCLTRCQPYLLQLIGSAIVNQANLQHTQLATTALLQAAIQDAFTNGEPYFTNIWTEFTGTIPAEVTNGQQILIALAQGNPHVETIDESTAARRRLLRYHVIERDGDIDKIEIPLFEQWVRERAIGT
jgi:hypothetical protein